MKRLLERLEDELCVLLGIALLALVFLQVLGRFTPWTFAWTEEISRYLFIWIVLVGGSAAVRTGDHVAFTALERRLGGRAGRVVRCLVPLCVAAFAALLAVLGLEQTRVQYEGENMAYSVPLPLWVVWAAIPASFALSAIWALLRAGRVVREWRGGGR